MFKYFKFMLVFVSLVLGIASSQIFAQTHSHGSPQAVTQATPQLGHDEVVITGKVICLGCHLKKEKQAKAQCSIYGHTNAIFIEKIYDAKGKSIDELKGKIFQFLHNEKSDGLIKNHSYSGKVIILVGKIYPEANILEVNFFKQNEGGDKE